MVKKNKLVISVDFRETRVALIEDGIIAELHLERSGSTAGQTGTVGNVYLGKVTRVLPGLQAAFIDIGQERAAFLHVEDLIRPDDFEAYLAGSRKSAALTEETATAVAGDPAVAAEAEAPTSDEAAPAAAPEAAEAEAAAPAEDAEPERAKIAVRRRSRRPPAAEAAEEVAAPAPEPVLPPEEPSQQAVIAAAESSVAVDPEWSSSALDAAEDEDEDDDDDDSGDDLDDAPDSEDEPAVAAPARSAPSLEDTVALSAADLSEMTLAALTGRPGQREPSAKGGDSRRKPAPQLDLDDLPGFTITDPGDPVPPPPAATTRDDDARRGGGRRGRGRKGGGGQRSGPSAQREPLRPQRPRRQPRPAPQRRQRQHALAAARLEVDAHPRRRERGPGDPGPGVEGSHRYEGCTLHQSRVAARSLRRVPAHRRSRRRVEAHRLRKRARSSARGDHRHEAAVGWFHRAHRRRRPHQKRPQARRRLPRAPLG